MTDRKAMVDAYIAGAAPFAQPILRHLRELVHASCPEAHEAIKWSMPFFLYGDTMLCNMAAFRAHCAFGFFDRRMTPLLLEHGVLCGNAMGSLGRIRSVDELPEDATMLTLLRRTYEFASEGAKSRQGMARLARPEPAPPADLLEALRAREGAAERFTAMSASCRREYVEWILEAKREETRARRTVEAATRIAEGKSRL